MNTVNISIENAFKQASLTANDFLNRAYEILDQGAENFSVQDAIALAHIMSMDFNSTITNLKLQEIGDSLNMLCESLEEKT